MPDRSVTTRPLESELRDARFECRGLETEAIRRPADAANPPAGRFKHALDVLLLHVDQLWTALRGRRRSLRWRDRQASPRRHDHCALDDIAELADVAGPRVLLKRRQGVFVDRVDPLAERLRELLDEAPDKSGNIVDAIA